MKKERGVIFIVLIILILNIIFAFCMLRKENEKTKNTLDTSVNLQNFYIENRTRLFLNDELLVGENKKELENGYYDFKVAKSKDGLIIYLNKLWYGEYEQDYIQDEYLAKICRGLVKCLNVEDENEEIEYQLYKHIKENYLDIRNGEKKEKIEVDNIIIDSKSIDNQCVLYIKVE